MVIVLSVIVSIMGNRISQVKLAFHTSQPSCSPFGIEVEFEGGVLVPPVYFLMVLCEFDVTHKLTATREIKPVGASFL